MAVLPITTYENPLDETIEFKTIITTFSGGSESRKQKYTYPRRHYSLSYKYLTKANALTLWEFYIARKGMYGIFYHILPWTNTYTSEYVGTGDGSTVTFNAPSKSAASYDVYLDGGSALVDPDDYSVNSSGESSSNQIVFVVAPSVGEKITFDFTGYLKVRCRFDEDVLNFQTFYDRLVNTGVKLKGLLNE